MADANSTVSVPLHEINPLLNGAASDVVGRVADCLTVLGQVSTKDYVLEVHDEAMSELLTMLAGTLRFVEKHARDNFHLPDNAKLEHEVIELNP